MTCRAPCCMPSWNPQHQVGGCRRLYTHPLYYVWSWRACSTALQGKAACRSPATLVELVGARKACTDRGSRNCGRSASHVVRHPQLPDRAAGRGVDCDIMHNDAMIYPGGANLGGWVPSVQLKTSTGYRISGTYPLIRSASVRLPDKVLVSCPVSHPVCGAAEPDESGVLRNTVTRIRPVKSRHGRLRQT